MEVAQRRSKLLKLLCRRRHETIANLAREFGVSVRTIRRDIEILSLYEPIYTQTGRLSGGIYVVEGYYLDIMYMEKKELDLLHKMLEFTKEHTEEILTDDEVLILENLIKDYTKPDRPKYIKQGEYDEHT